MGNFLVIRMYHLEETVLWVFDQFHKMVMFLDGIYLIPNTEITVLRFWLAMLVLSSVATILVISVKSSSGIVRGAHDRQVSEANKRHKAAAKLARMRKR